MSEIVNHKIEEYIEKNSSKEPNILKNLNKETYLKVLNPRMLSGHIQGRFLSIISKHWLKVTELFFNKDEIAKIIDIYIKFQEENNFSGIPKKLLVSMLINQSEFTKYKVYKTSFENKLSGFVFIAYHGDTATYLIGWTSYEGRKQNANYILLWNAICQAKKLSLKWFDMGGVNKNTPKGIRHFKQGVCGQEYMLQSPLVNWFFYFIFVLLDVLYIC